MAEFYQYAWEDYWSDHQDDYISSNNINIYYVTEVSFGGEFDRVVDNDIPILVAAFIVMLIYLGLTLGRLNCVEARAWMAFAALLSLLCALVMGLGLGCAFGFSINTLVLLIPFILLGVGVDDEIIIVEILNKTQLGENEMNRFDHRLGLAMKHAGLSITLTSFSSIVAFLIGANVDLPGISAFCAFAALCFLCNFSLVHVSVLFFFAVCRFVVFNFVCFMLPFFFLSWSLLLVFCFCF